MSAAIMVLGIQIVPRQGLSCHGITKTGFAGVGGGDDDADGLLVEAFEAAVALEVLEVAAQRALADELMRLPAGD